MFTWICRWILWTAKKSRLKKKKNWKPKIIFYIIKFKRYLWRNASRISTFRGRSSATKPNRLQIYRVCTALKMIWFWFDRISRAFIGNANKIFGRKIRNKQFRNKKKNQRKKTFARCLWNVVCGRMLFICARRNKKNGSKCSNSVNSGTGNFGRKKNTKKINKIKTFICIPNSYGRSVCDKLK